MFSPYVSEISFLIFFFNSFCLYFFLHLVGLFFCSPFFYSIPCIHLSSRPPPPVPPLLSFSVYNESLYAPLISSIDICCHDQSVVFLGLTRLFAKPTFFKMLLEGKIKTVIFNCIYFASTKSISIDDQPMLSMLIIVLFNFHAVFYQIT